MTAERYDVVIVGAGPAGIFAALEAARTDGDVRVLLLEKGHGIEKRRCPAKERGCVDCAVCAIMTGWGGAGAFSDGKLTLTTEVGGWLGDYVGTPALAELVAYADGIWVEFGATTEVHGPDPDTAARLVHEATLAGMQLVPMKVRHIGTDRSPDVLQAMRDELARRGVEIRTETEVGRILTADGRVTGVELADGTTVEAETVIAAPGREGADWLAAQARELGLAPDTTGATYTVLDSTGREVSATLKALPLAVPPHWAAAQVDTPRLLVAQCMPALARTLPLRRRKEKESTPHQRVA